MKQVKFKTPTGVVETMIAERWDELTFAQILEIERAGQIDPLGMFAILTGLSVAYVDNLSAELESQLFDIVSPLFDNPIDFKALHRPERILVDGVLCTVPRPDKLTLGQNIMFLQLAESDADIYSVMADAVAIYMQPVIDGGQFDRVKLEATKRKLLKCRGVDVVAVFGFFLSNQKRSNAIIPRVFNKKRLTQSRLSLTMKKRFSGVSTGLTK
jgi:hypothetical protein